MTDIMEQWNSPVIGAFLVWSLIRGYEQNDANGMPVLLVFLAMALLTEPRFHDILAKIKFTDFEQLATSIRDSSGKDSASFGGLTDAIEQSRDSTRTAIDFALASKLISLNPSTATISTSYSGDNAKAEKSAAQFNRTEGKLAQKLGETLAGASAARIATLTEVNF